jgi:hypothetical protein
VDQLHIRVVRPVVLCLAVEFGSVPVRVPAFQTNQQLRLRGRRRLVASVCPRQQVCTSELGPLPRRSVRTAGLEEARDTRSLCLP